ncbi:radical SAM protein [Paenibacillus sp. PvR098]|uniref:SPL family radical SAM protein n=1 Tax=unclassified Paenibacillus TaxID=185978 RepID=UPI001B6AD518|nr:DNA repair photolyase [Paenibacillus sp. PvP091]MBP1169941.1 DNA repair photolyase [Paenibacillus sp. PvR098]MBP2440969.1 DNA repair photolyase [Paenibacillus sp. PvP052]
MAVPTTFEPIQAKQVLNPVKAPSMPFDWSVNPYRGCQHGCSFCYARSTHTFLGMDADDTFQHHILYKDNAREALEDQIARMLRSKNGREKLGKIAFGTATDPYQPIESRLLLTRQCLEVMASYRLPVSITTRSPLILRDLDLLRKMPGSSVNISLNTLDKQVWRHFEPMTPSPLRRLEAVQRLTEEGVDAGIFMAPILPYLTDSQDSLERVVQHASKAGAQFIMGSVLRLNTNAVKSWFFRTVREHYPHLLGPFAALYSHSAYAPKRYREETLERLHTLLQQYRITPYQPFSQEATSAPPALDTNPSDPVQLSFIFEGEQCGTQTLDPSLRR